MSMDRARRSLYYPATYLLGTGFALLLVPRLAFKLFFSSGEYGDVMPRMAGAVIATLGMLVVQVIRHRVDVLYPTLVGARVFLCAAWLGLLVYSHDVFFGIVFIVVAAWSGLPSPTPSTSAPCATRASRPVRGP
jgi:uncharacterized protein YjeT (DUF2065 family)